MCNDSRATVSSHVAYAYGVSHTADEILLTIECTSIQIINYKFPYTLLRTL